MIGAILMASDIDTPPDLEPSSDGVPQWLVLHITKLKSLVKINYTVISDVKEEVAEMKRGQNAIRESLARTDQKIVSHAQYHRDKPRSTNPYIPAANNPSAPGAALTYKWVADWGMKALFLLLGGGATVAFKFVYDALSH